MYFNSLRFLFFFALITVAYFVIRPRFRWLILLAASIYYYITFSPGHILILAFVVCVTYLAGNSMEQVGASHKKQILVAAMIVILGVLILYKYFDFANDNISLLARLLGMNYPIQNLTLAFPIGISFFSLRSLSYLLEVYNRRQTAERHFGYLALFIMFFPQITAGPIERPQNLMAQFHGENPFEYQRVVDGLKWFTWGLFKKVVIADGLAVLVNPIFAEPKSFNGPAFAFAIVGYAIQLYADFSGYSDMAFGTSYVLGFITERNFKRPFFATSIMEFWQRWHISLSTWFRDYVFFPLRRRLLRREKRLPEWLNRAITVLTTMTLSGLWHGASWTFVLWGFLHGIYIFCWEQFGQIWKTRVSIRSRIGISLQAGFSIGLTFLLVALSFVIFRSATIATSFYIISHLFAGWGDFFAPIVYSVNSGTSLSEGIFSSIGMISNASRSVIVLTSISLTILFTMEVLQERSNLLNNFNKQNHFLRLISYAALVTTILLLGTFNSVQQGFIYFQF